MIIVRIYEGLGNQLFQYAYAKSLALLTNQNVFLDIRETGSRVDEKDLTYRKYYLNHYKISLPICTNVSHFYPYLNKSNDILDIIQKISLKGYLPYKFFKESNPDFNKNLTKLSGNWYLQGWFQSNQYFEKYEDIIRKEFTLKDKIKINHELKNILQTQNTVSVHIRRGDYRKISNILSVNYYYNALNHMKNMVENPIWIIFSDEMDWVKRNIHFGNECYFVDKKDGLQDYEELMVMSSCKHNIISNSTFSWWGAWLNKHKNKIVIGPDRWSPIKSGNSILLKNWIRVPII